jgi:elongator complex protein 2
VFGLLKGHSDIVTAVKFLWRQSSQELYVCSGSADKTIKCWLIPSDPDRRASSSCTVGNHDSSITNLTVLPGSDTLLSTGAGTESIKIWKLRLELEALQSNLCGDLTQEIKTNSIPLAIAAHPLHHSSNMLAIAGSHSSIQIYTSDINGRYSLSATLSGHSGWIRALAFTRETKDEGSDLLLASASQDKFIRLWRVHEGTEVPTSKRTEDPSLGALGKMMSTKAHKFKAGDVPYSVTFEALLLGHEDWVYSCAWNRSQTGLKLLSSSADNSVAIWEEDQSSGIWICMSRLGDVSAQKGSTTATGSTGGFWNGLWSPEGTIITSLGRTGSWRVWKCESSGQWIPQPGCGGHVRAVTGISWSKDGGYLLSTSSDQTTRLHAQWQPKGSWHEFSRPQIHGYDLNCIDVISNEQFVSGADEKPLRVFQQPSAVADILQRFSGIRMENKSLPDAANIPVLGLSNKAITAVDDESNSKVEETHGEVVDPSSVFHRSALDIDHPPLEDHLSKHLLWPETQKLYGHGYEISAVAVSHNGLLIATACKASSIDHAVIRIYETEQWRELPNPLISHTLTINRIQWSPDDKYLLSVGRDRVWSVFERINDSFKVTSSKGHSRMILDCSWAPFDAGPVFATAGRDRNVKLWRQAGDEYHEIMTIHSNPTATAVSFFQKSHNGHLLLAVGNEIGQIGLYLLSLHDLQLLKSSFLEPQLCPTLSVTGLAFRPGTPETNDDMELAIAGNDGSLRVVQLNFSSLLEIDDHTELRQ